MRSWATSGLLKDHVDSKVFLHPEHSKIFVHAKEPYDDPDREKIILN